MSDNNETADIWTVLPSQPNASQGSVLDFEVVDGIVPIDDLPKPPSLNGAPETILDLLFDQPDANSAEAPDPTQAPDRLYTYAILDAAKVINLPEILADTDLEHQCLFQGRAYDELMDVAPWIVRLEAGHQFTRNLFTQSDAEWHLWDANPGIYFRSKGTLKDMWRHFRKLTKVQDENGKWFYFRFWETDCLAAYTKFVDVSDQDELLPFFGFDKTDPSLPLVRQFVTIANSRVTAFGMAKVRGHNAASKARIDVSILRYLSIRTHAHNFTESYFAAKRKQPSAKQLQDAKEFAAEIALKYHKYGFKSKYHLGSFVYWATALKADFEDKSPIVRQQINQTSQDSNDRFVVIACEMKRLFGSQIGNYRAHGK